MTLARIGLDDAALTWGGIGNVYGCLVRSSYTTRLEVAPRLSGAVGFILPRLQPSTTRLHDGDVVILATNGVSPGTADYGVLTGDPPATAQGLLEDHRRYDEAVVLTARFVAT